MTSVHLLTTLLVVLGVIAELPLGICQLSLQACCDLRQLDAGQQAAVDVGNALPTGTYKALSVRFCTTDTVYIQIWTVLSSSSVQLKWQTAFTPTMSQTSKNYTTVAIQNSLSISSQDRLGLYSYTPGSNTTKMAVPYSLDGINGAMYLTQSQFSSASGFVTGLQATLSSTQFRRTFDTFVRFCTNADCSDQPAGIVVTAAPYPLPSCGCPTSCSPDTSLTQTINQQADLATYLRSQTLLLQTLINSLLSASQPTGYCPDGTVSGPYGDGYCYGVITSSVMDQFQAEMECEARYHASLVAIDNDMEEQFLASLLHNYSFAYGPTGTASFWTAGIFSFTTNQWIWSSQDVGGKEISIVDDGYEAFKNHDFPVPQTPQEGCLVLTVDLNTESSYWDVENCYAHHYPICKTKKTCL